MVAASDLLNVMILTIIIAVFAVIMVMTYQNILPTLNSIPGFNSVPQCGNRTIGEHNCFNQSITPYNAVTSVGAAYNNVDQWIPFMFFAISIAIIIAIGLIAQSPIVLALFFVIQVITVIISFVVSNALIPFFTNALLANSVLLFPNTISLIANMGLYELLFLFFTMIVIAAKARQGGFNDRSGGTAGVTLV